MGEEEQCVRRFSVVWCGVVAYAGCGGRIGVLIVKLIGETGQMWHRKRRRDETGMRLGDVGNCFMLLDELKKKAGTRLFFLKKREFNDNLMFYVPQLTSTNS